MAEIVLSEEETQAMVDRVLDQVEKELVRRAESDLYKSVVREAASRIVERVSKMVEAKVIESFDGGRIDRILDRAFQEKGYGSVTYALLELVRKSQSELQANISKRMEAVFFDTLKGGQ